MYLYRHRVRGKLGAATLVWINPRRVQFHCGSNQPYSNKMRQALHRLEHQLPVVRSSTRLLGTVLYSLEPFGIGARLLRQLTPIEENETYLRVADAVACREDLRQSAWYDELMAELKRDGVASHKALRFRSEAEAFQLHRGSNHRVCFSSAHSVCEQRVVALHDSPHSVLLMGTERDQSTASGEREMLAIEHTEAHGIELVIVFANESFPPVVALPEPVLEAALDFLLLVTRRLGGSRIQD